MGSNKNDEIFFFLIFSSNNFGKKINLYIKIFLSVEKRTAKAKRPNAMPEKSVSNLHRNLENKTNDYLNYFL